MARRWGVLQQRGNGKHLEGVCICAVLQHWMKPVEWEKITQIFLLF